MVPCASLPILLGQMKKVRLSPCRRENSLACSVLSHQPGFLMALLVVKASKRTPGNNSSTLVFSAWL